MKHTPRPPGARVGASRILAALGLLLALMAVGCVELKLPTASEAQTELPQEQSTEDLTKDAEGFFASGNFPQSELLYTRLLERQLGAEQRHQALNRLAVSAFNSRHYYQAKSALDRMVVADGTVLTTWAWHEQYIKTLGALNRPDLLENHRVWLAAHTELPFEVRAHAALAFAEVYTQSGELARVIEILASTHKQSPDRKGKAAMEAEYGAQLRDMPEQQLLGLARLVGTGGSDTFPHALIQRETKRRALAPRISAKSTILADSSRRTASDLTGSLLASAMGTTRVALVLPLTGRYATTAAKVLRGAEVAQQKLAAQGRSVEVKAINAEAADWREQLAALPPEFTVVGGPMQPDRLQEMQASGVTASHAVFAFLPVLKTLTEGAQAWRFFTSPTDQVRALVDLTADKLGIRSVAVLAPKTAFGQGMTTVFQAEAKAKGLRIAASGTYAPNDHPSWSHSVERLLKVPDSFHHNKNMPLPMPDFEAVFVPVDWDKAELLMSNFHFFEGQHMVFLGTELWSVALDNVKDIDDSYFQLAVCPGAWWAEAPAAKALQAALAGKSSDDADFWVALGHDFINFAAALNLPADWTPAQVNQRLQVLRGLEFSMAPITWDAEGIARQNLYLFSPRKEGKVLADPDELRADAAKAKSRRERRLVYSRQLQRDKKLSGSSGSLTKEPTE
ncbi:MAG: ABC transporter substrate-binding protein [Proteobacteria bacterium]|nr:ABC transporter substrate-binding protein [Pseudomonadota bacterium]